MSSDPSDSRPLQIGLACILGFAVIGFFIGTGVVPSTGSPLVLEGDAGEAPSTSVVPSYSELRTTARGTGSFAADLEGTALPGVLEAVSLEGTSKPMVLSDRAENRAYDGAPPTIPHPIRQSSAAECLACHEDGMQLRGRTASAMSHTTLASCTQCHVVSAAPMPGAVLPPDATFAANLFDGLDSPDQGERAWSIAPPEIPHRLQMRERCLSCHGPGGRDAMRSTHPDRQSCEQCHAQNAELDQRPVSLGSP
ncbi:MAG: cytochrome c-type protein NapB [Myxococcota bacterium]|jgi:cytochrome c-type protein NapB